MLGSRPKFAAMSRYGSGLGFKALGRELHVEAGIATTVLQLSSYNLRARFASCTFLRGPNYWIRFDLGKNHLTWQLWGLR